ncbi:uncharacterized protein LOC107807682 [Nicotiana tabacum]|uniref:Uncharacterized protein LOC107807682 n=1 Tax=Nicotiana tabacum TaxID=4097 RepID=A0AC58UE31_TOBAC
MDEAALVVGGLVNGCCDEDTTNEHATSDGISVEISCEEERVECSAPDQVLSTGIDVDAIIEKIVDRTFNLSTPQSSENILQNTVATSLIPLVMDIQSFQGGKNNKDTNEAAAVVGGLEKICCHEDTTNEQAGGDGNSFKIPCDEERIECSAPNQVQSTGKDVASIMQKIVDGTYQLSIPECSKDNNENRGAVSSMLSAMDIQSLHDAQNKKCSDQGEPSGTDVVNGPFCNEERTDCSPDEINLTAGTDIDSLIRKINDVTYDTWSSQSNQNILQNTVIAVS